MGKRDRITSVIAFPHTSAFRECGRLKNGNSTLRILRLRSGHKCFTAAKWTLVNLICKYRFLNRDPKRISVHLAALKKSERV